MKIKPEFGNLDQIQLIELESKYKGMKTLEIVDCDCLCPNCEAVLEECPYCENSGMNQFTDDICDDCGKKIIPYDAYRKIQAIKYNLSKSTQTNNPPSK